MLTYQTMMIAKAISVLPSFDSLLGGPSLPLEVGYVAGAVPPALTFLVQLNPCADELKCFFASAGVNLDAAGLNLNNHPAHGSIGRHAHDGFGHVAILVKRGA